MDSRKTFIDLPLAQMYELSSSCILVSQISAGQQMSFKIKGIDLAHQLLEEFKLSATFKSMAYEDKSHYARIDHDHDIYTSADFIPNDAALDDPKSILTFQNASSQYAQTLRIEQHNDYVEQAKKYAEEKIYSLQPRLGEIMFQTSTNYVNIDSEDFNGWLPANGGEYALTSFVLSNDLIGIFSNNRSTFFVPNLQGYFMKLANGLNEQSRAVAGQTAIPWHTHQVSYSNPITLSADINGNFGKKNSSTQNDKSIEIPTYKNYRDHGNGMHYGKPDSKGGGYGNRAVYCNINLEKNALAGGMTTAGATNSSNNNSYPGHFRLPAFVYVGRSYASKPLIDFD